MEIFKSAFRNDALKGKKAFITGGGSGICKGIARTFLECGAEVCISSRNQSRLNATAAELSAGFDGIDHSPHGGKCHAYAADVRNPDQVAEALDKAVEVMGGLDIVVNGAAGNFLAPAEKLSPKGFKTVMEIDAHGTYNVSRLAFDRGLRENGGSILNISATLQYAGTPCQVHAGSAKAAIDAMTKHLAVEWGRYGIRVNGIAPGPIDDTVGMSRLAPGGVKEKMKRSIPLGRFGEIHEIAEAAVFLSSASASYITGAVLVVDGGAWMTQGQIFQQGWDESVEK